MASESLESGELPLEDGELPREVAQEVTSRLPVMSLFTDSSGSSAREPTRLLACRSARTAHPRVFLLRFLDLQALRGEEPRPQHPYRDEWAGPRRDGSGGSGGRELPPADRYPRGPLHRRSSRGSGDGGWGYGGPGTRRRSPSPPPGRVGYHPANRGPRGLPPGRYPPMPPSELPLPPPLHGRDRDRLRDRGSSLPRSRTRSPLLRSPRSRSPPLRSRSPPALPQAASPPSQHVPSAEDEAARDAREMDTLAADIKSLCRGLTLPECMKWVSWRARASMGGSASAVGRRAWGSN